MSDDVITLLIARHGNTFSVGETPRRVGARTDLPLVEKGFEQGKNIGRYLTAQSLAPQKVYTSYLQRTIQTAQAAIDEADLHLNSEPLEIFNEIDYGPDENLEEDAVISRLGQKAMDDWEAKGITPDGWSPNGQKIIDGWHNFAAQIQTEYRHGGTVLVVTSGGIARFAPHLTGDFDGFASQHTIKVSTGGLCIMRCENDAWRVDDWNIKP